MAVANTLLTSSIILEEGLFQFENNLVAGTFVNKEYSAQFAIEGAKKGDSVSVRYPPKHVVSEGQKLVKQDTKETSVTIRLDHQDHIGLEFSNRDLLLSISNFSKRILTSPVSRLANKLDLRVLALAREFYNAVGTPGVVPTALATYLDAGVLLSNGACPTAMRTCFLTAAMEAKLITDLRGLTQDSGSIAQQYLEGKMKKAAGFMFGMDQNCATHIVGPLGGTPLVDGANQTGSTLLTKAWTSAAANRILRGDRWTIGSGATLVRSVNPQSFEANEDGQIFVALSDQDSTAGGALTLEFDPPLIAAGAEQTVDALPADGAAINVIGAANTRTKLGFACHPDAITLVTADLPVPNGADMAGRLADDQLGISMRLWRDGDINEDAMPTRIDILNGQKALRKELGCVVYS